MSLMMFSLIEIEKPKRMKPVLALVCFRLVDSGSLYSPQRHSQGQIPLSLPLAQSLRL